MSHFAAMMTLGLSRAERKMLRHTYKPENMAEACEEDMAVESLAVSTTSCETIHFRNRISTSETDQHRSRSHNDHPDRSEKS